MFSDLIKRWAPLTCTIIFLLFLLEVLADFGFINSQLIPPPSGILSAFRETKSDFIVATVSTITNSLKGLFWSFIVGTILAMTFSLFITLRRAVLPLAIFFQTVPIIAIAPLLVIYLGFDDLTVVTSALIVSIFPVIANTLVGLDEVDHNQIDLFRIYSASKWQILWRLRLPSSYPSIVAGLKISSGLALIGTIAGEFVTGSGLGGLIDVARTQQKIDLVFLCIYTLSLIGLLYLGLINLVDRIVRIRRPFGLQSRARVSIEEEIL